MPEVIEVYLSAQYLNSKFKNKYITNITVLSGRYLKTPMKGLDNIIKKLPLKIKKVSSKGKFMWFELYDKKNRYYIMNTYGLTGKWVADEDTTFRVADEDTTFRVAGSDTDDSLDNHNSSRVMITIEKNDKIYQLYYIDPRNFGTLAITSDKNKLDAKLSSLGPDLLKTSFTDKEFYQRINKYIHTGTTFKKLSKKREEKEVVKVLMDQKLNSGLGSGIGSYLAIEILYHAKISPRMKMKYIYRNKRLAYKLSKSIKYIIKLSYLTGNIGYLEHFPPSMINWLRKLRNEIKKNPDHKYNYHKDTNIGNNIFSFKVYRQKKDPLGNIVTADKIISGRTTYWVKNVQKRIA